MSETKSPHLPGISLFMTVPVMEKIITRVKVQINQGVMPPTFISKPWITPSCALQGIVRPSKVIVISFSLSFLSSLVVTVAMVTQPPPKISGIMALPFIPSLDRIPSASTANLGR